jgi:hypothetical protein
LAHLENSSWALTLFNSRFKRTISRRNLICWLADFDVGVGNLLYSCQILI